MTKQTKRQKVASLMQPISKIKISMTNLSIYTNKAQQNLTALRGRGALSSGWILPTSHSNAALPATELHFLP